MILLSYVTAKAQALIQFMVSFCSVVTKSHTAFLWLLLTLINRKERDSFSIQHLESSIFPEVTFYSLLQLGLQRYKVNANELWIWITMTGEINYHKLHASIPAIWVIVFLLSYSFISGPQSICRWYVCRLLLNN